MNTSYLVRLTSLCLGSFFFAHLAASLLAALLARSAVRRTADLRPQSAARIVFCLRLLPAIVALFFAFALCLPSYLLLEPMGKVEEIGPACLGAAFLGASVCVFSFWRAGIALFHSFEYLRRRREDGGPVFLLAGVFASRIVVSRAIRDALTSDQFGVALRHEEAHWKAKDNLKRLLLLIVPDVLPFCRPLQSLDSAWQQFSEWAADDYAVADSSESRLALASALVCVSRLCSGVPSDPLHTSLTAEENGLKARVERLLEDKRSYRPISRTFVTATVALALTGLVCTPLLFHPAYRFLEALAR